LANFYYPSVVSYRFGVFFEGEMELRQFKVYGNFMGICPNQSPLQTLHGFSKTGIRDGQL
jgi:hypothetical protein